MPRLSFLVPLEYDGTRLDTFLRREHGVSGTALKLAKKAPGGLLLDGAPIRTIDPVRAGGRVSFDTGEENRIYEGLNTAVPILFEDELMVAYDKPAGMPTHPSKGHPHDTLANVFAAGDGTAGLAFRPVNRLDKDTSGIVIAAKGPYAGNALQNKVEKQYLAVAYGELEQDEGVIDKPIGQPDPNDPRRAVMPKGREAVTQYRVLARQNGYSLLVLSLLTGRTHQIRVHLAYLGHPLAGDALYGGPTKWIGRQALHCFEAGFLHPTTGEIVTIAAPPAGDLEDILGLCGKEAFVLYLKNRAGRIAGGRGEFGGQNGPEAKKG